ncbi:MAG: TonB-dependent receptor [Flavobacteriales bacterium]|nr:TonB-dependent receptor [Flavobacteriales bacterium]
MKKKIKLLGVLILLIMPTIGFSQGEIKGKVFEEDSKLSAPGASVYVEVGGVKIGTMTDIDGRYQIKPLQAGTYNLYIKVIGMNPIVIEGVVVNKDKITWITDMFVSESIEMDEFVVVGIKYEGIERLIKPEDPTAMTLTYKDLEHSPVAKDPISLIATMPGVTQSGDGQQLYFRGARADAVLYFIDGVKNRGAGLGIPSVAIGEITVYTGGIPAKYGDVTGGIVVVETKSYFDLYNRRKGAGL